MKKADQSLGFACPICAAQPGTFCVTILGTPRNQSHLRRRDIARDYETTVRSLQSQPIQTGGSIRPSFD
jgi:hypothetical protein